MIWQWIPKQIFSTLQGYGTDQIFDSTVTDFSFSLSATSELWASRCLRKFYYQCTRAFCLGLNSSCKIQNRLKILDRQSQVIKLYTPAIPSSVCMPALLDSWPSVIQSLRYTEVTQLHNKNILILNKQPAYLLALLFTYHHRLKIKPKFPSEKWLLPGSWPGQVQIQTQIQINRNRNTKQCSQTRWDLVLGLWLTTIPAALSHATDTSPESQRDRLHTHMPENRWQSTADAAVTGRMFSIAQLQNNVIFRQK